MKLILGIAILFIISGCSSVQVKDYQSEQPQLVLEKYLNGELEAHGFFQDRSGKIAQRFKVVMKATWDGPNGKLVEDFIYSDGKKSQRIWYLKKEADGKFTGTASDVDGVAVGETAGNAFRWNYTLKLPVGESIYHVQFDDWMYLMDEKVMLNKSKMTKFGFYLGEVTLVFLKKS